MNILLGLTGSVATVLAPKLIETLRFELDADVKVISTNAAEHFAPSMNLSREQGVMVYTEEDEWLWGDRTVYHKGDNVLHIALRDWADVFVIAPLTANTMAKMVNGICDNLLTSVYRAWDANRPIVIAPAMNTYMWENPITKEHVKTLLRRGIRYVKPITKLLACGDYGDGALAEISSIVSEIRQSTQWSFPIHSCSGIPVGNHPGSFGAKRKHDRHCGVDLYCNEGTSVFAVESGRVVVIEQFTGDKVGTPWWKDTWAIKIEGSSGVVCYGEIELARDGLKNLHYAVGSNIERGHFIGRVIPVLPPEKWRKDIPGHSTSMLHLQLYARGKYHKDHTWENNQDNPPEGVLNPTDMLINAAGAEIPLLDMKNE